MSTTPSTLLHALKACMFTLSVLRLLMSSPNNAGSVCVSDLKHVFDMVVMPQPYPYS